MQIQDKAYAERRTIASSLYGYQLRCQYKNKIWLFTVPNAKTKLTLIYPIFHFAYEIQQNVTI